MSILSKLPNVFFKKIYTPKFPANPIKIEKRHNSIYSFILEIYNTAKNQQEICIDDYYSGMDFDICASYVKEREIHYHYLSFETWRANTDEMEINNPDLYIKIRDFFGEKIDYPAPITWRDIEIFSNEDLNYIQAVMLFS